MPKDIAKTGILGGGLAGLTLRYFLKTDNEIVEKESECGGLCRSIKKDGFVFDQGGHILFSKKPAILDFAKKILGENLQRRRRNNKIYYDKRFIKYPFENDLAGLSKNDNFECLLHYLKNDTPSPENFKEWLYFTFGKGIAKKYLIPYNEKIWKFDTSRIDLEWVERIPKPPLEDIIKSSLGIETEGYLHQLYYLYPKQGGIQSLTRSLELAKDTPITKKFTVKKVSKKKFGWLVSDGAETKVFDKIVSTIPIFDLVNCMESVPKKVLSSLNKLKCNPALIVMLGLNTDNLKDYTAVYFPQKDTLYHRVCFMNNFGPNNAPPGKAAIMAEITTRKADKVWNMNDKALMSAVVTTLDRDKILNKKRVEFGVVHRMKYAYVIHDLNHKRNTNIIKKFFASVGIELLGRFAEFEYINMDETINRSIKMAKRLDDLY